jgi:hypothetical protein
VRSLADADALVEHTSPVATGRIDLGDLLGFNTGEGSGHFLVDNPVPGITQAMHTDNYAVQATGYLVVPATQNYTFGLNTDDGARLRIDNCNLIVNDGIGGPHDSAYVATALDAGPHTIEWTWFNAEGGPNGGGAEAEVFAAPGVYTSFNSNFRLVGDAAGLDVVEVPEPSGVVLLAGIAVAGVFFSKLRAIQILCKAWLLP